LLQCSTSEIFFTSGGTEADNCALRGAIATFSIQHVISSSIEHSAVLQTLQYLAGEEKIQLHFVDLDKQGQIDLQHLASLLQKYPNALVSLMHANNEIGNLNPIEEIGEICRTYKAFFHSDTVQTIGHFTHDLSKLPLDYLVASAHKFHGPKGIGFLYVNRKAKINPLITGGAQERNMRGGTENVYGIVGLAKAMEIAYAHMSDHRQQIEQLKKHLIEQLQKNIEGISFNGTSADLDKSLYTVLNVCLPASEENDMLLFNLDLQGISSSGGSACSSGAAVGSHVLAALQHPKEKGAVRFSFSKFNTLSEIDYTVEQLITLYKGIAT
ncbi:MAG: cysteine desulfurase family protein, partial [Bacteroidota bacterium]